MMSWGAERYRRTLRVCLNFRWVVIAVALAFFVASISLVKYIKKDLVPSQDQSRLDGPDADRSGFVASTSRAA